MQRTLFDLTDPGPDPPKRPSDLQIAEARQRHPGMVLLFRNGDSYDLFGEDAAKVSELLV